MKDTFGWRLRATIFDQGLKQEEVLRMLEAKGVFMQKSNLSKILNDGIHAPSLAFLRAIRAILHVDLDYLITGEHTTDTPDHFITEEANEVGEIIDSLPPELRGIIRQGAQLLLGMHQEQQRLLAEQYDRDIQIAMLLERNINFLADDHRKEAHEYIASIRRRRNTGEPPGAPTDH